MAGPDGTFTTDSNQVLTRVHDHTQCAGRPCVIHRPSAHHMRQWPTHWRADRMLMERICPHGVGHPDFDDIATDTTHACDGCCSYDLIIDGLPAKNAAPGYAVRSDGTVWSFWTHTGPRAGNSPKLRKEPRPLKGRPNSKGYLRVQLGGAKSKDLYVHRLTWEAWNGPIPTGLQVRHLDGDSFNNALFNLALGTQRENESDKRRHGTTLHGGRHPNAKLTKGAVVMARSMYARGETLQAILDELNLPVTRSTLHEAVTGKTWRSLEASEPSQCRPNEGFHTTPHKGCILR